MASKSDGTRKLLSCKFCVLKFYFATLLFGLNVLSVFAADLTFDKKWLPNLILDNAHESAIFQVGTIFELNSCALVCRWLTWEHAWSPIHLPVVHPDATSRPLYG